MKPLLFISLIAIDQITKYIFPTIHYNTNFAFSLPVPTFLIYTIYVVVLSLIIWYSKSHKLGRWENIGIHFIFAGAISNIAERILLGSVRDFIPLPFQGIWNLADFFIVIGIGIILMQKETGNRIKETV